MHAPPTHAKRKRPSTLKLAFLFSTLFHLSMVTVFSIVIYFPREDVEYLGFELVRASPAFEVATREKLRLSAIDPYAIDELDLQQLPAALPDFRLPTIEFSELQRLQLSHESRSHYGELFSGNRDSWALFTQSLRNVRLSLAHLGLPGQKEEEAFLTEPVFQSIQPFHPGFAAYIEWNSGPQQRALLSPLTITALENPASDALQESIEVVFKVNREGRVVNVWSSHVDEFGFIDSIQIAVLTLRFAPREEEPLGAQTIATEQMGTLHLARERGLP